jgi:hypothetical protein
LVADKGYDSDAIVEHARAQDMQAQIPPRKHRKVPREYGKHLYRHVTWWKMPSCISSQGAVSPRAMPSASIRFLLPLRFAALPCG